MIRHDLRAVRGCLSSWSWSLSSSIRMHGQDVKDERDQGDEKDQDELFGSGDAALGSG